MTEQAGTQELLHAIARNIVRREQQLPSYRRVWKALGKEGLHAGLAEEIAALTVNAATPLAWRRVSSDLTIAGVWALTPAATAGSIEDEITENTRVIGLLWVITRDEVLHPHLYGTPTPTLDGATAQLTMRYAPHMELTMRRIRSTLLGIAGGQPDDAKCGAARDLLRAPTSMAELMAAAELLDQWVDIQLRVKL